MRYLLVVMLLASAAWAQLPDNAAVDPEMADAIADRNEAQARIDSLAADATMEYVQAAIDTLYPNLIDKGVVLTPCRRDAIYVYVELPYSHANTAEKSLWRETKLAVGEAGIPVIATDNPWVFGVHRVDVNRFLGVANGIFYPSIPE